MASEGFDRDVVVIGAGAAGLFAATEAALAGADTLLVEKNRKPGVKILASGGTKCNVTSTLPIRDLGLCFGKKGERFLRYGLHECGPDDVRRMLDEEGVGTDEFPMEKVFPTSGKASDVLRAFLARMEKSGAELAHAEPSRGMRPLPEGGWEVCTDERFIRCKRVIVTSGGCSYPKTGTTGEGYAWLDQLGMEIVEPRPALVPLLINEPWLHELTGIAVQDAVVESLDAKGKPVFMRRRPVLFTHRGLSGPGPMDCSSRLIPGPNGKPRIRIDWLPDVPVEEVEARFRECSRRRSLVASFMPHFFPRRLNAGLMRAAGIPEERSTSELRKDERAALVDALKRMELEVDGNEGFDKAEVTRGGLALSEVDSRTMECRSHPGLHVAGEILDLDGPIGGFNFQAAFSTGLVAGRAAAR